MVRTNEFRRDSFVLVSDYFIILMEDIYRFFRIDFGAKQQTPELANVPGTRYI